VLLRRGPKRHFHLIAWDLDTHTFTPGQWMKGVVRLCDLSPSGERLLYWVAQYHPGAREWRSRRFGRDAPAGEYEPLTSVGSAEADFKTRYPGRKVPRYLRAGGPGAAVRHRPIEGSWTAVSRPPYFSALAIWPSRGTWTGGGYFRSEREIVLFESEDGMTPLANVPLPIGLKLLRYGDHRSLAEEDLKDRISEYDAGSEVRASVARALNAAGAIWVDWVGPQGERDLLFAADGAVYRLTDWRSVSPNDYLSRAERLADFKEKSFELVRAPSSAMRW